MIRRPTTRATRYVIAEPSHDPNVPAITTPVSVMCASCPPYAARIAAGGITISLGTGKMELSIAMRTITPM